MKKDYYDILGLNSDAGKDDIKKAYRKLALKYHPDQNKNDKGAETKFKEISDAYDVLKDENKRKAYDSYGHAAFDGTMGPGGPAGAGGGGAGFGAFSDIFDDMFGDFMGGQGGDGRGSDIQYNMDLTLEEAFAGKDARIRIPLQEKCDECDGSGAQSGTKGVSSCDGCGGAGRVRQQQGFFTIERTCPKCGGQGDVIKDPCKKCKGSGRTQKQKTLQVKIPAGVQDNRRIRLTGEGEAGVRGGKRGDLYILVNIKPHEFFNRQGPNLFCRVPIPITQAALGGDVQVPTIEGKKVKVKIPPGTQTGQQFRLKGRGMSTMNSEARGDAYIEIFVETPINLDKKQEDLIRQLDGSINDVKAAGKHTPESSGFFTKVKEFWDDLKE